MGKLWDNAFAGAAKQAELQLILSLSIQISLTMFKSKFPTLLILLFVLLSCNNLQTSKIKPQTTTELTQGSFGYDHQFLSKFDSLIVLKNNNGQSRIIVSPKYQGKVFTSTAEGDIGRSFGWINYKAFTDSINPHMNAYGGENRLWLGPEGGPYSLYFSKGSEMIFDNWKVPAPIDTEPWTVNSVDSGAVHLEKIGKLKNYTGASLQFSISRNISIMDSTSMQQLVSGSITNDVHAVGYTTENTIRNTGKNEWNERTGMPCIWVLDMFPPSAETIIFIPFSKDSLSEIRPVTTNYFGEIPPDRIQSRNGIVYFLADGKRRGKLGIAPWAAQWFAGSYDAKENILTIVAFDVDRQGKYLNQEWTTTKPPFSGDAVNAYNDGPLANGNQLGPFYEIESVAPAAFLKAGNATDPHKHSVLHFTGSKAGLDKIAMKVFGVSIDEIRNALK